MLIKLSITLDFTHILFIIHDVNGIFRFVGSFKILFKVSTHFHSLYGLFRPYLFPELHLIFHLFSTLVHKFSQLKKQIFWKWFRALSIQFVLMQLGVPLQLPPKYDQENQKNPLLAQYQKWNSIELVYFTCFFSLLSLFSTKTKCTASDCWWYKSIND